MSKLKLIATTTFGIEAVAARELLKLGYADQQVENGRVTFTGDEEAICRSNLWLRTADRVLLKMGEFSALSFEQLFQGTKALPWEDWLPENAQFPVDGKSLDSKLSSVPDCQAIVKKAIVERLKQKYNKDWFEENGPKYKIEVALLKDVATLTIDTTGPGLHKRGYRTLVSGAPLKETLASAMILISHWKADRVLVDPFCGSGTIPIEAAMIGRNIAPGLNREFVSQFWPNVPESLWKKARVEARQAIKHDQELRIYGSDINDEVLSLARYHAQEAGVEEDIHFQRIPMNELRSRFKYGVIICNPPYGERLGELPEVEKLYKEMGKVFNSLETWSYYVITSHMQFEKLFGRIASKKRKLYNGRLLCNYYQFFGPPPPKGDMKITPENQQNA